MASLVDLERLQNERQMSHQQQQPPQQLKTYMTPSLTPQGPQRPMNESIVNKKKSGISNSGKLEMHLPIKGGSNQHQRNASRTDVHAANSFIHGRKVDSPKIFPGFQVGDDRPKTSAQQTRKVKTKEGKDAKKKANHQRKNANQLNATQQVVATSTTFQGKTLLNLGLQTNKEVESRKFDFGLPPHSGKVSSNQASANASKKKTSIAKTQNSKMHRHQRNYTTTQQDPPAGRAKGPQINNFFSDESSTAIRHEGGSSTLEFEPVNSGANSTSIKNNSITKSSKTVRERDGNVKTQLKASLQGGGVSQSQSNSNYQQIRKRQLSQNMPKSLLNASQSTGSKPPVSLNTTQVVSTKSYSLAGPSHQRPRGSIGGGVPQTTKSLLVKPPIGNSLAQKKKSMQVQPSDGKHGIDASNASRSYRSGAGSNHTRTKSVDKTKQSSTGKAKYGLTGTKLATKSDRGRGNFHSQMKTTSASVNTSAGFKNLSAHLLEHANPIQMTSPQETTVRTSMPAMGDVNKENLTTNIVVQQPRTMRQTHLSGDEGDFSISSMSDSSHRVNKNGSSGQHKGGNDSLGKIFGKNYFVDGEQLLRHISPSQPRSPRESHDTTAHCINLLNVTAIEPKEGKSNLALRQSLSGKRSKTTRGHRSQTKQAVTQTGNKPRITLAANIDDIYRTTLESDTNLGSNLLSGKTNKSQLDGLMQNALSISGGERKERSQERERSKSNKRALQEKIPEVSKSFEKGISRKQKLLSVDKLIKKNIRQKGKQTAEEMLKKFMDEKQKQKRKQDINNMNQEIKKQNASRHPVEREVGHSVIKPFDEKKHRSRSCINNRDNFFQHQSRVVSPNLKQYQKELKEKGNRDKSQDANKTAILSNGGGEKKRHPPRDKNTVIELSMLKKEVDDEIRRERKQNLMMIKNPKMLNSSAIVKSSSQKERSQNRTTLNQRTGENNKGASGSNSTSAALNYTSLRRKDPELLLEQQNLTDGNIKAKVKRVIETGKIEYNAAGGSSGLNTSKIQKFIEKQKKRNAAKTKMQATIEHEKILRVHENLTKLHNYTLNNRLKQSGNKQDCVKPHPPSTTNAKSGKKQQRERSGKRRSDYPNQQTFGLRGPSAEREPAYLHKSFQDHHERRGRPSRFNSNESRRKSSGHRYQDPGETLNRSEDDMGSVINVYERKSQGSSPQTRKLSGSRYSGSDARSPQTRMVVNLSGSATAPLRVLKPKLASGSKQKRDGDRLRSIEADQNTTNYGVTHGLYQSLDSEKVGSRVNRDPLDNSKQFESIEPGRANLASYEASKKVSPDRKKSRSPPRAHSQVRKLVSKYAKRGESEDKTYERINGAASSLCKFAKRVVRNKLRRVAQQTSKPIHTTPSDAYHRKELQNPNLTEQPHVRVGNVDDLIVVNQKSSELKSRDHTSQSQRMKTSIPQLALHKVQSHDGKKESDQSYLGVPQKKANGPLNQAYSNRSMREPECSTSRSIFERNTFRQFAGNGKLAPEDFKVEEYPKMLKIREEAIAYREKTQQKKINNEFNQNKISPRTFKRKNLELEQWVTKEKEEVSKTKKKFEKEHQKSSKLMPQIQHNYEQIRSILHGGDSAALNAASSRRNPTVSEIQVTEEPVSKPGVLDMIYDRDGDHQHSKESRKSSNRPRHSLMDGFNNDPDMLLDSESADGSDKNRIMVDTSDFGGPQQRTQDQFHRTQQLHNLKEVAAGAQSGRSSQQFSGGPDGSKIGSDIDDQDALLDQVSVQDPFKQKPTAKVTEDMSNFNTLKINEKSEDTGSLQAVTPNSLQWTGFSPINEGQSKVTSPVEDTNASYIDKSMTRQFDNFSSQHAAEFDSRKASQDSKMLNTRKIDTNSSFKSGESAPEPPQQLAGNDSAGKLGGLARVTSYNKLERNIDDEDLDDSYSEQRQSEERKGLVRDNEQNQDLKPAYDVVQLDQANIDLAKKVFDEGSPNSIQSHPNVLNQQKDGIQNQVNAGNFFLNKIGTSGSTSHDDLHTDSNQTVLNQLNNLNTQPLASPTMPNTTPLSTDSGAQKIKIEISGKPEQSFGNLNAIHQPGLEQQNLQSPLSTDSAAMGIRMGSVSLSSSTSKEGSNQPMPHMALPATTQMSPEQDVSMLHSSQGPDMTFGVGLKDTSGTETATGLSALEDSSTVKADDSRISQDDSGLKQEQRPTLSHSSGQELLPKDEVPVPSLTENSLEKPQPGSDLSPQMQAAGEAFTNELLEYLLQDLSNEGLDHLLNRQTRRQQEVRAQLRAQCTGIKTDLFAIERYVDEIHQRIALDPEGFFRTLYKPLTREALKVLNQLQNSEIGSCDHFDETYPQVLPLKLYLSLEKKRKSKKEEEAKAAKEKDPQNENAGGESQPAAATGPSQNFDSECEHIHNKVLFDCINDSLLQFKPFGKDGEPLPWSRSNRRLKPTDDFNLNEIFEIVKHDLFRWAINLAGTLPRREFIYQGEFDEELFSEIREKKLVQLLAREMIETEPKWLNYEFEQAQVKIDVGDMILEQLVNETISILNEQAQREFSEDAY